MRQHACRLAPDPACACCRCRGKCEDDCDRAPAHGELVELRRFLPLLRRLAIGEELKTVARRKGPR